MRTTPITPETIGQPSPTKIPVELSTRFLEHFSEQLYSSPQKAFEELISNGWDAGAKCVDVRVSADLKDPNATMCVLDNGSSMDADGLRELWHIAFSPKQNNPVQFGRQVIGKFGIGKLATYVLANKLTYICKAPDGVIRRVTMDYGTIDMQAGGAKDRLISDLELQLYEVNEADIEKALVNVHDGDVIFDLLQKGVPRPKGTLSEDEFGAPKSAFTPPAPGTWTLVVLSDLKPTGRNLRIGVLRRMLEAALPFESEMAICLNGQLLASSKIDTPTMADWRIGPELDIDHIEIEESTESEESATVTSNVSGDQVSGGGKVKPLLKRIPITSGTSPVPYVDIPQIGRVTGRVRLFKELISAGKSEDRGASNGFHVNVLGRVVNQKDPYFGEENLSHTAWASFRMAVRADGLNQYLVTNREQFKERNEIKIFRAFLRKVFNKARGCYDHDTNSAMPDGGDVLVQSLGVLSLNPLRNVVSEALKTQPQLPGLFDDSNISNREEKRKSWRDETAENIKSALGEVKYERIKDNSFVKFRLSDNSIIVNKEHPFVEEHNRTKAEKELVRTIAMVNLLSDVYALDIGVPPATLESIREYRDRLMRFRALQRRQSGTHIAKLLLQTQHDSSNSRRFEAVLSDALKYLGFQVKDLAKPGEPEGIASAFTTPSQSIPTRENPHPALFTFSFDAKSSKHDAAKTGNISLDGVVEHRNRYKANYALVVAPGFQTGAIETRCREQKVTPITAYDLGKLLEYTVEYGAIPFTKLREVFQLFSPAEVSIWVKALERWLLDKRQLTIDIFLKALENLKGKVPNALPAEMIAFECREHLGAVTVMDSDVKAVAQGLSILVPDLVGIEGDKIVVNVSAARLAAAVGTQLEKLHSDDFEDADKE